MNRRTLILSALAMMLAGRPVAAREVKRVPRDHGQRTMQVVRGPVTAPVDGLVNPPVTWLGWELDPEDVDAAGLGGRCPRGDGARQSIFSHGSETSWSGPMTEP